jgi:hypothetical protein
LDHGGQIGEKRFFKHPATGKAPNDGLDDCIGQALKKDPCLSTGNDCKGFEPLPDNRVKAFDHFVGDEMLPYATGHLQLTAAQKAKRSETAGSMLQMLES